MPTYDYRCKGCKHEFELFQSMRDPVKRKCPKCGKNTLERLIGTGAALVFKGSGFYQTDYRSDSYKKSAEAESKSKSDTSAASPSEPKPAPKAEGKTESKAEPTKAKTEPKPAAKPAESSAPSASSESSETRRQEGTERREFK